MNLSIEDLEAIKAIVRKTVREELERVMRQRVAKTSATQPMQQQTDPIAQQPEQSAEVVARIRRN